MENQTPQNNGNSLLDQIIASSKEAANAQLPANGNDPVGNPTGNPLPPNQNPGQPPKPRDPMTAGTVLKLIGTLFLVLLIFFGAFLSYIVFNPEEAKFFVNVFGILPSDIATVLSFLLNGSFGIISAILSVVFLVSMFRAIWTPKEQKRKKLALGLFALLSGIIFFSVLGFWIFLFNQLGNSNFSNPDGDILIYENDLHNDPKTAQYAQDLDINNLIGPVTLKFNISDNAKQLTKRNVVRIDSFTFEPDGAKCIGNIKEITDLWSDIICTFDQAKKYNIGGFYTINNYTSGVESKENFPISISPITIQGLTEITERENKDGKLIRVYDASKLQGLGTITWQLIDPTSGNTIGNKVKEQLFSTTPTDQPAYLYFNIEDSTGKSKYSQLYIVKTNVLKNDGTINITQNPTNPQEYIFTLTGVTANPDDILSLDWKLNNSNVICSNSRTDNCSHVFTSYGQFTIEATVNLIGNQTKKITETFQVEVPLLLERGMRVMNKENKLLNTQETFDPKTKMYVISGIVPPSKIFFDARDVISDNPGYQLTDVSWSIHDGSNTESKSGMRIELDLTRTARHTITAKYTFEKTVKTGRSDDTRSVTETIMIDMERKNLNPVLKVTADSAYAPVRVIVDASQSQSEYSEIMKFIFDFGEGRTPAEGDAIQTYTYTTAGEKEISVTIIDSNGERATTKETLVLKEAARSVDFTTSLSPAQANLPVDFTATENSGQVEEYLWNFGDNTPIKHGYEVSHTFKTAGTYVVTLVVRYTDGTEKTANKKFSVVDKLE